LKVQGAGIEFAQADFAQSGQADGFLQRPAAQIRQGRAPKVGGAKEDFPGGVMDLKIVKRGVHLRVGTDTAIDLLDRQAHGIRADPVPDLDELGLVEQIDTGHGLSRHQPKANSEDDCRGDRDQHGKLDHDPGGERFHVSS